MLDPCELLAKPIVKILTDPELLECSKAGTWGQVKYHGSKVITAELFDEKQIVEVFDPRDPKRRYCLCRNPQTAGREGATRERLLERTGAQLGKIAGSRRRASAQKLGARVGRVLERSKMGKFVRWDVIDGRLSWSFDQDKIAAEIGNAPPGECGRKH